MTTGPGYRGGRTSSLTDPSPKQAHIRTVRGWRWIVILLSLYISTFIYGLDTTIAADVQGPIVEDLGHIEQLAWIGAGFPMGSMMVVLLNGVLYSNFNIKWVYLGGTIVFQVGSAVCGAAPSMKALIVGRVIAGLGGSGVFMGVLSFVTALASPEERGLYITGTGFFWGIGTVLGPIVGGSFVDSGATWRWSFYINLIIGAAFAPAYIFGLPSIHPVTGISIKDRVRRIDFLGLLLNAAIWVTFTMGFTMAGGQWPWRDGRTITMIVVFGVLVVAYALQQTFCFLTTVESRSFPIHLLRSRSQVLLYIGTAANIGSMFIPIYFLPIYFQFVHGDTAIEAAVRLLPCVVIAVVTNLAIGHWLSKIRYYMVIFVLSGIIVVLGGSLFTAYLAPDTPVRLIYAFSIITGFGSGLTLQIGFAIATLKAPNHMGDALALQNISQIGTTVIYLVLSGQVFQSAATKNLTKVLAGHGFSQEDIRNAIAGAASATFQVLSDDLRARAIEAITDAMQEAFILVCVGGGVVLIVGLLMKRERLFQKEKELETVQVAA
ncbi:major facilitator superfamily domain-containing protein [Trichoderma barbatum]